MRSPTRVLMLAGDALDDLLVRRWAAEGVLPTFRRLMGEGTWATTLNPCASARWQIRTPALIPPHQARSGWRMSTRPRPAAAANGGSPYQCSPLASVVWGSRSRTRAYPSRSSGKR